MSDHTVLPNSTTITDHTVLVHDLISTYLSVLQYTWYRVVLLSDPDLPIRLPRSHIDLPHLTFHSLTLSSFIKFAFDSPTLTYRICLRRTSGCCHTARRSTDPDSDKSYSRKRPAVSHHCTCFDSRLSCTPKLKQHMPELCGNGTLRLPCAASTREYSDVSKISIFRGLCQCFQVLTAFALLANLEVFADDVVAGILTQADWTAVRASLVAVFALERTVETLARCCCGKYGKR